MLAVIMIHHSVATLVLTIGATASLVIEERGFGIIILSDPYLVVEEVYTSR